MGSKFCHYKENTNNYDADNEKWGIWYSALKFIKKTESKYHSDNNNPHLTQTQVKNNGIFVFYLNRNLVLHGLILP